MNTVTCDSARKYTSRFALSDAFARLASYHFPNPQQTTLPTKTKKKKKDATSYRSIEEGQKLRNHSKPFGPLLFSNATASQSPGWNKWC